MLTRQQSRQKKERIEYEVNIDFDEASRCWNANKVRLGNGWYAYNRGMKLRSSNVIPPNMYVINKQQSN